MALAPLDAYHNAETNFAFMEDSPTNDSSAEKEEGASAKKVVKRRPRVRATTAKPVKKKTAAAAAESTTQEMILEPAPAAPVEKESFKPALRLLFLAGNDPHQGQLGPADGPGRAAAQEGDG